MKMRTGNTFITTSIRPLRSAEQKGEAKVEQARGRPERVLQPLLRVKWECCVIFHRRRRLPVGSCVRVFLETNDSMSNAQLTSISESHSTQISAKFSASCRLPAPVNYA